MPISRSPSPSTPAAGRLAAFLFALLAALLPPWSHAGARTLQDCEARFELDKTRESARCFFDAIGQDDAPRDQVVKRLEALLGRYPRDPWLHFYLGHVLFHQSPERAEEAYRKAANLLAENGDFEEIDVLIALVRLLSIGIKPLEEAEPVLERAFHLAEQKGDPLVLASVQIRRAYLNHYQFRDLDHAYTLLQRIRGEVFSNGSDSLRRDWLQAAFLLSDDLGRSDVALTHQQSLLAMAQRGGDRAFEAEARLAIAILHINYRLPSPSARQQARELLEQAQTAAEEANYLWLQARALLELGKVIGGETGREHIQKSCDIASRLRDPRLSTTGQRALAESLLDEDPAKARARIDEVLSQTLDLHDPDPWFLIYGWEERLAVDWATLPRPQAINQSLELLDRIKSLRELQGSDAGRAGLISYWSNPHYWISGRLLESAEKPMPREDLELAFEVLERLRAQVLLQALMAARATAAPRAADAFVQQLDEILKQKVKIQRRLLDPRLDPSTRGEVVAELHSLELREAEVRYDVAEASPSYASLREPVLTTPAAIEESLDEDEAFFSFQLGLDVDIFGRFAGGAWLLASTRGGTRVYRIPDRVALELALDVLFGMDDLDDAKAALARLYADLLAPALADLPTGVDRLVIVPDGKLYRLPFALLRPSPDGEPLISRYRLSYAPSATLWRRWRGAEPPTSAAPVLALADPVLAGQSEAEEGSVRQWAFADSARLVRLPFARQEGEAIVDALGGESLLLVGEDATERFLKETDLHRYGVIHFATHAVINDEVPERSAVLLAPGAEDEDGWLQPQDIVGLDLDGRVVVLASCSGAGGQVLRGEGPMSLARAFFQAGAPVVVASLWPLPDDASARLFKRFYGRLARGAGVADALAEAQREMARRGVPARAWAGLVVLGNGDLVPFPGGLPGTWLRTWVVGVPVLLALFVLVLLARRRRRG